MLSWRKHWELLKRSLIKTLTYRAEIALWMVLDFAPIFVLLFVLVSLYAGNTDASFNGYTLPAILQYYLIAVIVNGIVSTHFESWRVGEIREGKIDFFLVRPLPYPLEVLWADLGGKCLYLFCLVPFYLLLWWLLSFSLPVGFPQAELSQWLVFGFLLLTTYAIEFLLALGIVFLGFWIEGAEGLEHFKWLSVTLLSGSLIPLSFMPSWLRSIIEVLPFKYMYAYPIGILQGTTDLYLSDVLTLGGFIGALILMMSLLWRKARYQYASHGG